MADSTLQPGADQRFIVQRPGAEPFQWKLLPDERPFRRHQLVMNGDDIDETIDPFEKGPQSALLRSPFSIHRDEAGDIWRRTAALLKKRNVERG